MNRIPSFVVVKAETLPRLPFTVKSWSRNVSCCIMDETSGLIESTSVTSVGAAASVAMCVLCYVRRKDALNWRVRCKVQNASHLFISTASSLYARFLNSTNSSSRYLDKEQYSFDNALVITLSIPILNEKEQRCRISRL